MKQHNAYLIFPEYFFLQKTLFTSILHRRSRPMEIWNKCRKFPRHLQRHASLTLGSNGPFPYRQTFEFGKSISTAGKSILNFKQLSSLVAKYCKWKTWPHKICDFCILLYYARKSVITTMWKFGNAFSRVIQKYTKFANFALLALILLFPIFYNQPSQFH